MTRYITRRPSAEMFVQDDVVYLGDRSTITVIAFDTDAVDTGLLDERSAPILRLCGRVSMGFALGAKS